MEYLAECDDSEHFNRKQLSSYAAARYVLNGHERSASVTLTLKQLHWETLELRRGRATPTMLYKMYCNLVEVNQQKYLELAVRSSRHSHKFFHEIQASEGNYHLFSFHQY